MELRVLRYFVTVARMGNVTRAAAALHVTQPTLSRQLSDLERELGCTLMLRRSHGIELTQEGMLLLRRAEEIVGLVDRTEHELSPSAEVSGDVFFGGAESIAMSYVTRAVRRVRELHPGVRVHIHAGNADDLLERMERGLVDFSLVIGRECSDRYDWLEVPHAETAVLVVPRKDPLAGLGRVGVDELSRFPLVISDQRPDESAHEGYQPWSDPRQDNVVATYNLLTNALLLVRDGVGYAVAIAGLPLPCDLCEVPIDGIPHFTSRVMWRRNVPRSHAANAFLEALREACAG